MLIRDFYSVTYQIVLKNGQITPCKRNACFSILFRFKNLKEVEYVDIDLIKEDEQHNHCVLLDKEKIIEFLKYLQTIVKFKFELEESEKKYVLYIKLIEKRRLQIIFLFTCIRKLFEFPYNVALYDWFQLYKKRWKKIPKLTLLYFLDFCCDDNIHGLCKLDSKVCKINKIKLQEYLKTDNTYLQNFIKEYIPYNIVINLKMLNFKLYHNEIDSDIILTEEAFTKRLNLYNNIYKTLKNENICR